MGELRSPWKQSQIREDGSEREPCADAGAAITTPVTAAAAIAMSEVAIAVVRRAVRMSPP
jgi:hypothetical protein